MKIISAHSAFSEPMTENETKHFLANSNNNLLMHIGTIDSKEEPNVTVTAFYFDERTEKIYVTTLRSSKKVQHLNNKNIISFCIDDPNVPYKGVRGKGTVKLLEDIQQNVQFAKKFLMKLTGNLDNPVAKLLLGEIEKGDEIVLEITPRYFSTWVSAMPTE
jgi:uncharacterized pyridoxamine 5'-phosphate oxidase family protein